jgi:protein TonB
MSATDFVQQLDLSSLVQPDLSKARLDRIPEHFIRGSGKALAEAIFNLADLDRVPEPTLQARPIFPPSLKESVPDATVVVAFIVDARGSVVSATVVSSTHPGFESAAIAGVEKWRFRPGMKGGRKVGARMQVPIIFRVSN